MQKELYLAYVINEMTSDRIIIICKHYLKYAIFVKFYIYLLRLGRFSSLYKEYTYTKKKQVHGKKNYIK